MSLLFCFVLTGYFYLLLYWLSLELGVDGGWGRSAEQSTSFKLKLETLAVIDGKDWELVGGCGKL